MCVSWSGWCSWNFRFGELISIDIKNVRIVKVSISFSFSGKIVSTEDDDRSSWQSSRVTTSRTRTDTFNNRISPLPPSDLQLTIWILAGLLRIRSLTFLSTLLTLRVALLVTVFRMLWLLHLLHIWALLLVFLVLIRSALLIAFVLLLILWMVIALHEQFIADGSSVKF